MPKHFLTILDLTAVEAMSLVARAAEMKRSGFRGAVLADKAIVMLFEKASTRTRISFEIAIRRLGGAPLFMTDRESQLGRSEPLADTARVISRYAEGMVVRTFGQHKLDELARHSSIPVVNALSDEYHPCQVMSDMLTMFERTPDFEQLKVAWIGDGNNMAHSFINAARLFPFELALACPAGFEPNRQILDSAISAGARITLTDDPRAAARDADYVNTDVWASMGQEQEQEDRARVFEPFQVNEELMRLAKPECKAMHCLPAHRGEEISQAVLEGPASIVWDQAENRLHMQMAILEWIYG